MDGYEEMAMRAISERDMAVKAIIDFLDVMDTYNIKVSDISADPKLLPPNEVVLPLTPAPQASAIHQLRMLVKTLRPKLNT